MVISVSAVSDMDLHWAQAGWQSVVAVRLSVVASDGANTVTTLLLSLKTFLCDVCAALRPLRSLVTMCSARMSHCNWLESGCELWARIVSIRNEWADSFPAPDWSAGPHARLLLVDTRVQGRRVQWRRPGINIAKATPNKMWLFFKKDKSSTIYNAKIFSREKLNVLIDDIWVI